MLNFYYYKEKKIHFIINIITKASFSFSPNGITNISKIIILNLWI